MNMKINIFISTIVVILLTMLMFSLKKNYKINFSQKANVECGFNSLSSKNFKFSNQFFMIAIIFVIFDMELIVLMPLPTLMTNFISLLFLFSIINLLTFSLLMEWLNGLVQWIKS